MYMYYNLHVPRVCTRGVSRRLSSSTRGSGPVSHEGEVHASIFAYNLHIQMHITMCIVYYGDNQRLAMICTHKEWEFVYWGMLTLSDLVRRPGVDCVQRLSVVRVGGVLVVCSGSGSKTHDKWDTNGRGMGLQHVTPVFSMCDRLCAWLPLGGPISNLLAVCVCW